MKTKTVLALTLVGITTLFAPLTTEARGFLDNIIKIPQKIDVNNIIKNASVKNYHINLDGTYYGVAASRASGYKNNDKIMTATFYISRPCLVSFHIFAIKRFDNSITSSLLASSSCSAIQYSL